MSESEARRLDSFRDFVAIAAPLVVALVIVLVVFSKTSGETSTANAGLANFDFVTPAVVSLVVIALVFQGMKRRPEQVARVVIAGIMISGTLSGLILLKIWFDSSSLFPATFYLCAAPLGYLGIYLAVRSYFRPLSEKKTALFLGVSTTFIGAIVGVSFPPLFTIFFLFALSLLDILMIETDALRKLVGLGMYDTIVSISTVSLEQQVVGVGDLLAYSMLTVASIRSGSIYVAIATVILILIGAFVTAKASKSRLRMPGLPIPVFLGAAPYLIGLLIL
ncbi:hypothetical protein J2P12_03405 [Candidatus Bathyarchaeota archaeon]|nr:hypothetical protein [Candidatus Bathyarchaeota archaeon]